MSCKHFSTSNTSVFKIFRFSKDEVLIRKYLEETFIVFLVCGRVSINHDSCFVQEVSEGNIFLLPKGLDVKGYALEETLMVLCNFTSDLKLCSRFALQELNSYLPHRSSNELYFIETNSVISDFIKLLIIALESGLACNHFHALKRDELFLYLRAGFSKEELALLFRPILGGNIDFKDFVLTNYKRISDVKEFADNANMSVSTFNRRFKETFNDTAKNWLLTRRSESIYKDVVMSDVPFGELSDKYSFSSPSYFARYCKKIFGKTAMELRRENKNKLL